MKGGVFFLAAALFLPSLSATSYADIEYWKVVEVTGLAQIKSPAEAAWKDLAAPFYLKRGSVLRTGKDSSVDLCLNRQWDSFLRLNENSELEFPEKIENGIRLKSGSISALLEKESTDDSLRIFLPDLVLKLSTGGLVVSASGSGTTLKVFSEFVEVEGIAKPIQEGWEWTQGRTRRMDFSDYTNWQLWVRQSYERKDKHFLKHSF